MNEILQKIIDWADKASNAGGEIQIKELVDFIESLKE